MRISKKKITISIISAIACCATVIPIVIYSSNLASKQKDELKQLTSPFPGITRNQTNNIDITTEIVAKSVKNGTFYLNLYTDNDFATRTVEEFTTFNIQSNPNLDESLLSKIKNIKISLLGDFNKVSFDRSCFEKFYNLEDIKVVSNNVTTNNIITDVKYNAFPKSLKSFKTNFIFMPFNKNSYASQIRPFEFNDCPNLTTFTAYINIDENDEFYTEKDYSGHIGYKALSSQWAIPKDYFRKTAIESFNLFGHIKNIEIPPRILIKSDLSFTNTKLSSLDDLWYSEKILDEVSYTNNLLIYSNINFKQYCSLVNNINKQEFNSTLYTILHKECQKIPL